MIYLRILILSLHLILMNLASVGPLLSIWLDARSTRQECPEIAAVGRTVGWWSVFALVVGIVLGLIQGILVWSQGNEAYFRAVDSVWDSKIFFGFWEIGFSLVCTIGYLLWWQLGKRGSRWQRFLSRFLAILAATNLLYHFPTLFTILGLIARGEVEVDSPVDSGEFRSLLVHGEVIWFTLHFWFASFAVSGLVTGISCLKKLPEDTRESTAGIAFTIALVSTLLQIPVGFVLTTTLNSAQQSRLMGGDTLCTAMFALGVGLAFWLMHLLAGLAFFDRSWRKANMALMTLAGTIVLMTATMLLSRGEL
ncbi:hypothetical protein Pan97_34930 [Bremerella volcania]|uniref:Uncharacterized protein n=1 Tax=Bremerella volcania TaxID=2527984 RepID=A0A518CB36_9BACT|nr:hypothetical protein [Bremerella volcania]QDU76443.1 hypothetical protein Pan97_34930 [Bremerella volcania]